MTEAAGIIAADIPPGERLIVDVGGRSIGIFNVDGRFAAVCNVCPPEWPPVSGPGEVMVRDGDLCITL